MHAANASFFPSATWRLIHALSTITDKEGNILIPDLKKNVNENSTQESQLINSEPLDCNNFLRIKGRNRFKNSLTSKEDILHQHYNNTTCNINGVWFGCEDSTIKVSLPNQTKARIDFRLVGDQNEKDIVTILRNHLDKQEFTDVEITEIVTLPVARSNLNNEILNNAIQSIEKSYCKKANVQVYSGGSGPAGYILGGKIPMFTLGANYPGTNAHSPNENIYVEDYLSALFATIKLITDLACHVK